MQDPAVYTALEPATPSAGDVLGRTEQTSFLSNYLDQGVKDRQAGSLVVHGPTGSGVLLIIRCKDYFGCIVVVNGQRQVL